MRYNGNVTEINDIEKQAIYYRKEQKVYHYAIEFFKEIVPMLDQIRNTMIDEILPLFCFNKEDEILRAIENDRDTYITGGMLNFKKKQAVIRIGLDCNSDRLTATLKRTIRHEIIHYCMWLMDREDKDNQLDFWCYCYVFDGGAYEPLSESDEEKFRMFRELYDKHIAKLSYLEKVFCVDDVIKYLKNDKCDYEEYKKFVKERCAYANSIFSF